MPNEEKGNESCYTKREILSKWTFWLTNIFVNETQIREIEEIQRLSEVSRLLYTLDQFQRTGLILLPLYSGNKFIAYTKPTSMFCSSVAFLDVQTFRAGKAWTLGFKFQPCHILTTWSWQVALSLTLSLSLLTYQMWK